jgi:hypothetical protein
VRSRLPRCPVAAFSKIELIVILAVVAVIVVLAWPTLKSALVKRDLTRTMNNGRELYLIAFRMVTDGVAKSDSNRAWPGDYPTSSLTEYGTKLVQNGYAKPEDLQRILCAPGAECQATASGPPATLLFSGKTALKLYKVKTTDPSNTIFAASSNYFYDTPLNSSTVPFGEAGFVVVRKSGRVRQRCRAISNRDRCSPWRGEGESRARRCGYDANKSGAVATALCRRPNALIAFDAC